MFCGIYRKLMCFLLGPAHCAAEQVLDCETRLVLAPRAINALDGGEPATNKAGPDATRQRHLRLVDDRRANS